MDDNLHRELEELSPLLRDAKQQAEHRQALPKDYFATMQKNVLAQLKAEDYAAVSTKPIATNRWWQLFMAQLETFMQPRYSIGFGSLAAIAVAFWWWSNTNNNNIDNCTTLACVPDEEIETYLSQNIDDIPTEELWNTLQTPITLIEEKAHDLPIEKEQNHQPKQLKDASEEEINELLDQMIQNDDIPTEDIEELL